LQINQYFETELRFFGKKSFIFVIFVENLVIEPDLGVVPSFASIAYQFSCISLMNLSATALSFCFIFKPKGHSEIHLLFVSCQ